VLEITFLNTNITYVPIDKIEEEKKKKKHGSNLTNLA
jgi:hypothetical protein